MALQSSGTIKMSEINTELGRSSNATISLDTAENGGYATINTASPSYPSSSNPASMSEWYSYDHSSSSAYIGLIARDGIPNSNEACQFGATLQIYKNGSSSTPAVGDLLYANASLTTNYNPSSGFGLWYKYEDTEAGNLPYSIYLLQGAGGTCFIEAVNACF
jgi:hypothetical protein